MWVGVCLWANSGIPLRRTRVRFHPEAISGTPLLEQEFALREATVGKGLEVQYEYIRTPTGKRQKETTNILLNYLWNAIRITTRKLKQWLPSRFNFCVNSQTPHASKKKRHKPYFLPHTVTVARNSSKLPTEEKPHLPSGWQQKCLSSKHPL